MKSGLPEIVTFDCYGTLIDWETGITSAFRNALSKSGRDGIGVKRMFELYQEEERRVEKEEPYRRYREVLSESVRAVGSRVGWDISDTESGFLAEDLPNWKPFADTNPALERLAAKYTLGILSNVDDDLLAGTLKHLVDPFEIIVTAEQVRSYKPRHSHFETARRRIGRNEWLHVASSMYHDIEPARKLGIRAVWVNRPGVRVPEPCGDLMTDQVRGLEELADRLET